MVTIRCRHCGMILNLDKYKESDRMSTKTSYDNIDDDAIFCYNRYVKDVDSYKSNYQNGCFFCGNVIK